MDGNTHEDHTGHAGHSPDGGGHGKAMPGGHHRHMMEDFRKRFIVSMILTVPILVLSPSIQYFLGFSFVFTGSDLILLGLSTIVYLYGGYPFLAGIVNELRSRLPGMMTLIAVAITIAYVFSAADVLGLISGKPFFWE